MTKKRAKKLTLSDDESLDGKMEQLAVKFADELSGDATPNGAKISAFRALTAYFTATRKLGGATDDDEAELGFNFRAARGRMNGKPKEIEQ